MVAFSYDSTRISNSSTFPGARKVCRILMMYVQVRNEFQYASYTVNEHVAIYPITTAHIQLDYMYMA